MKSFLTWACLLGIAIPVSAGVSKNESIKSLNRSIELQESSKEPFHSYIYPDDLPRVPIHKIVSASFPDNARYAMENHLVIEGYQFCLLKKKGVDEELTHENVTSHAFGLIELLAYDDQAQSYFAHWINNKNRTEEGALAPYYIALAMDADCQIIAKDVREILIKLEGRHFDLNDLFWEKTDERRKKEQEK